METSFPEMKDYFGNAHTTQNFLNLIKVWVDQKLLAKIYQSFTTVGTSNLYFSDSTKGRASKNSYDCILVPYFLRGKQGKIQTPLFFIME